MSGKIVRLNENKVSSLVRRMIREGLETATSKFDLDSFSTLAYNYEMYAKELNLFVEEFKEFEGAMLNAANGLGLSLVDIDVENDFEYEDGKSIEIKYTFGIEGVDVQGLYQNDDMYDEHTERTRDLAIDLESEIGPRSYRALNIRVTGDEYVNVECRFGLWL